jgi:hypothetical protein
MRKLRSSTPLLPPPSRSSGRSRTGVAVRSSPTRHGTAYIRPRVPRQPRNQGFRRTTSPPAYRGFAAAFQTAARPSDSIILPEKTLALLDRNVFQFVQQRARLRKAGMSSKKGLLFYGPPGTGKTHTIRYLSCIPCRERASRAVVRGRELECAAARGASGLSGVVPALVCDEAP